MKIAQSRLSLIWAGLAIVFLSGCGSTFHNLTDERIPQNASNIYTFSFKADFLSANVDKESAVAYLVINGETLLMDRLEGRELVFVYDYPFPPGVNELRYYYQLDYEYTNAGIVGEKTIYSTDENYGRPFLARLTNRYPIQLVSSRGRVGDRIAVVGSGFSEFDAVRVGESTAETRFRSPNSLEFIVPPLDAGRSYPVVLEAAGGDLEMGSFRVDQGALRVSPDTIDISSGDPTQLTFMIDGEAPSGGFSIDVTTDVPESVIMPEVTIPAGSRSVSIIIEGGAPGQGQLVVEAPGFGTQTIPVRVD
ncbi:MAG: IPT/TIG domain-containing protein [Opitutales bacterium]